MQFLFILQETDWVGSVLLFSTIKLSMIKSSDQWEHSHPTFQSNSFLKHWGEMLAPQKSKLKTKHNPEKQRKRSGGFLPS